MLDTIRVSITEMPDNKINKGNGWSNKPNFPSAYKKIRLDNKASIFMEYFFWTRTLVMSFSASKIQHGTNAVAYDFDRSGAIESIIEQIVALETGVKVRTKDMLICRLDLNRDLVFKTEERANAALEFSNKILPSRYEKRFDYDTGLTSQTKKGNGVRVYRKDKDIHLSKSEREEMDPTVRFEFQMNRKLATKIFGERPNLHQVLTNQVKIEIVWNKLLDIYALNKKIISRKELHQFGLDNLTIGQRETIKQMNDTPSFSDKKHRQKQLAVTRKMKSLGICPYSCETAITLTIKVCNTIMKMRKEKRIWNNTANKRHRKSRTTIRDTKKSIKWYLDSSQVLITYIHFTLWVTMLR